MNIAVNVRLLIKDKLEGIGWFTYETIRRIVKEHPEHKFFFLFDRDYDDEFVFEENVVPVKILPPTRHAFLWYLWFEILIPRFFKKERIDLFISPDGYLSIKAKIPSICVMHDINFVHRPYDIPFWANKFYNYYFPRYARKANRVVTVSNYSKLDIANSFDISPEKIDVAYNGVNPIFAKNSKTENKNVKNQFTNGEDYFVFVGAMHPRKNIVGLLKSFEIFKQLTKNKIKLVIVGEMMFKTGEIKNTYQNLCCKDDIVFVGRLSPDILKLVVGGAISLVFVPFFEGFGIPIVEAMRCGTPVICSNRTSMPEVAGEAAIIVDPNNMEEIADAMIKIESNKNLQEELSNAGLERSKLFSWDKTANELWKSIEKIIENA